MILLEAVNIGLTIQSIIYQHAEVGDVVLLKPCAFY